MSDTRSETRDARPAERAERAGGRKARHVGAETRARRPALDLDRIVRAALAVLDKDGFDGLNMRRLADELGVKAASLYWYVRDKDELLELLGDVISGEMRPPDPDLPWRARLEALMEENRRVLLAHRDAVRVLVKTRPVGLNRLRLVDVGVQALLAAGFRGVEVLRAGRLLNDYVTSFVLEEVNEAEMAEQAAARGQIAATIEDMEESTQADFAALPAADFPGIAAVAAHAADPDLDARFRYGMKVILDGLERQLARPSERPRP